MLDTVFFGGPTNAPAPVGVVMFLHGLILGRRAPVASCPAAGQNTAAKRVAKKERVAFFSCPKKAAPPVLPALASGQAIGQRSKKR